LTNPAHETRKRDNPLDDIISTVSFYEKARVDNKH